MMGKLLLAAFDGVDKALRERSIRKALEKGKYWYAADLCKEVGEIRRAGDIYHEYRDFTNAVRCYDKANHSHKLLKAMLGGYKRVIEKQGFQGDFFWEKEKLETLKRHHVLEEFLQELAPFLSGELLFSLADDLQEAGEEKLANEHFLRLAREGEEKWYFIYDKVFKYYLKTGQAVKAREIALEWFKTGHSQCGTDEMFKLREVWELEAFAEEAAKVRRFYFFDQLGDVIDFGGFGEEFSERKHNIKDFEDVIDLFVKHYKEKPAAYNVGYVAEWYEKIGKPEKAMELRRSLEQKNGK